MFKEKPMLFSAPMVVALHERRKTQTRRIIKPINLDEYLGPNDALIGVHRFNNRALGLIEEIECPYGKIGDHLWVKENWRTSPDYDHLPPRDIPKTAPIVYIITDQFMFWGKTRPNIFMCRWMSRFTLEITDIRVQRVQDISEEDAKEEGIPNLGGPIKKRYIIQIEKSKGKKPSMGFSSSKAKDCFEALWNSINDNWDVNPWVWVLTFKRIDNE